MRASAWGSRGVWCMTTEDDGTCRCLPPEVALCQECQFPPLTYPAFLCTYACPDWKNFCAALMTAEDMLVEYV